MIKDRGREELSKFAGLAGCVNNNNEICYISIDISCFINLTGEITELAPTGTNNQFYVFLTLKGNNIYIYRFKVNYSSKHIHTHNLINDRC